MRLARAFGFATVSVNMRGTGCSGGVFDIFNPAQQADGYDVVEIVGRQSWVKDNKVGMVGLSYSGITQLYVAATRPPHLAGGHRPVGDPRPLAGAVAGRHLQQRLHRAVAGRARAPVGAGRDELGQRAASTGATSSAPSVQDLRAQNPDFRALRHRR